MFGCYPFPPLLQALYEEHALLIWGCPPFPLLVSGPPPSISYRPNARSTCCCLGVSLPSPS